MKVLDSNLLAMPITIECLEQYSEIDKRIIRFILVLSAIINKSSHSLYTIILRIFLLQYNNEICTVWKTISIL